ncbi:hypothetical protein Bca52824_011440 [Brassica carinata]|uniref:Uncharacterized protein n=1 Tax=Brassica carinata TaxID=52824 RepID=A0A8X7WGA6_BRACI|nr:hypothetical protein Bca52824_011440 [Brassica carinata]
MVSSSILLANYKLTLIEKVCIKQIILKPALDNDCGILRMICKLDSKTYKTF